VSPEPGTFEPKEHQVQHHRNAATQSPARLLHLLAVIAAITNDVTDVDDALPLALGEICRFAEWPVGQACLVSGDGRTSHHSWHVDDAPPFASLRGVLEAPEAGDGLVQRVLATSAPVVLEKLDVETLACGAQAAAAGLRSAIAVPVRVGESVVAVLGFYSPTPVTADSDTLDLLQTVGVQLVRTIERGRSLEVLHVEHARQRLFFEASSDAIIVGDASGRITEANTAAAVLLGCSADKLVGMQATKFVAPEWADLVKHRVDSKLKQEEDSTRYECVLIDFSGNRIPVEVTSTALRDGNEAVGIYALIRDLRQSRRSERALRESEERFRGAFDAAPIGMALAAPDGRWLKVNGRLCELLGYTVDELMSIPWQEVTHPDDLGRDEALARGLLAGEYPSYELEKRFVHKDGTAVWVHLCVSLVNDESGSPAYSVAQVLDIDDRKRRELGSEQFRSGHPSAGSLSPREREVLGLLALGKTSAEAGVELGVSEETVQTHVRRSMAKLDARSRTQAVASAIRLGWLDDHVGDQLTAGGSQL
jgi:PAS domain S-box-containing protein